ncbi:AAA family ATPase [Streptomyces sp. NPDC102467]|uniref:AAA family ATPase n=1 Tax=Streptomyces sp. NPDC102467 TaxID=3366179 RepID=UPI00380F12F0
MAEESPGSRDIPSWWVFTGSGTRRGSTAAPPLPKAPPWRRFPASEEHETLPQPPAADEDDRTRRLGSRREGGLDASVLNVVNAAIHLRRPLLVTGEPGTGKSTLAHHIAAELGLGRVLWWPVVSRTTLRDGLYSYDAIGRVHEAGIATESNRPRNNTARPRLRGDERDDEVAAGIGRYLTLGPLGTALLPWARPRMLLVDELDKSDLDLPNDLLHVLEEGEFGIPELERIAVSHRQVDVATSDPAPTRTVTVHGGRVRCREFPIVVFTSNGERQFSPAFRRRCMEIRMPAPTGRRLAAMVASHFDGADEAAVRSLTAEFVERAGNGSYTADQLLNAVHMVTNGAVSTNGGGGDWEELREVLWRDLTADG